MRADGVLFTRIVGPPHASTWQGPTSGVALEGSTTSSWGGLLKFWASFEQHVCWRSSGLDVPPLWCRATVFHTVLVPCVALRRFVVSPPMRQSLQHTEVPPFLRCHLRCGRESLQCTRHGIQVSRTDGNTRPHPPNRFFAMSQHHPANKTANSTPGVPATVSHCSVQSCLIEHSGCTHASHHQTSFELHTRVIQRVTEQPSSE